MTQVLIRLKVKDFDRWRADYDRYNDRRRAAGWTGDMWIYRDRDDPETVTLLLGWDSEENARVWFAAPSLEEVREEAGIVGYPEVHLLMAA